MLRAMSFPVRIADRFRGFLPVVVDVETGGFDPQRDALLEIAASIVRMDESGCLIPGEIIAANVVPFPGANIDPRALEITGIEPDHPFRAALDEREALKKIFQPVRAALKETGCQKAILVGHNAAFDLAFLNAAVRRTGIKRNPFHLFSTFDTVSLAGLAFGQTVLAKAAQLAGLGWDNDAAHSAIYDTKQTAALFCEVVNRWHRAGLTPTVADPLS